MENSEGLTLDETDTTDSEDDESEEQTTSYDAENYDCDSEYSNDGTENYDVSENGYYYEYGNESYNYLEQEGQQWSCDTCEKEFSSYRFYSKHISEHRTCGIDNCQFTAHEKIIEKHIKMQHLTNLYNKICKVSTPQDITKWIAERRKKYPTKENIEKRYKQQEEMLKRGERIGKRDGRFANKSNTRLQKSNTHPQKKFQKSKVVPQKVKKTHKTNQKLETVSLIDEKCDWNGTMFPFGGTKDLYKTEEIIEVNNFDDTEWVEEDSESKGTKLVLNNALGALIGAYNSSDDSDIEELIPADLQKRNISVTVEEVPQKPLICDKSLDNSTTDQISDDEPPLETKICKTEDAVIDVVRTEDEKVKKDRGFENTKNKARKRFHRRRNNKATKRKVTEKDVAENDEETCFNRTKFKKRKTTLLENLLDGEIRHERNVLLQCVRFVVNNKFFL